MSDSAQSEFRNDPHHGGWVLVAPQPQREQLSNLPFREWPLDDPGLFSDPEASGAIVVWSRGQAIQGRDEIAIRVLANKHPLYRVEEPDQIDEVGVFDRMGGLGAHELIVESQRADDTLESMSVLHVSMIFEAVQERIRDLKRDIRLHGFSYFREWACGPEAPAAPPHSQFIASAIVPHGLQQELDAAQAHYDVMQKCFFCEMIDQETSEDKRTVSQSDQFIALCPYASRYPFEVHVYPLSHQADFSAMHSDLLNPLADMVKEVSRRIERALPGWTVLMALHTRPALQDDPEDEAGINRSFHWHLEFMPQPPGDLNWALRAGTPIIHTAPEAAANFLRSLDLS